MFQVPFELTLLGPRISFLQGALAPFCGEWFSEIKILALPCSSLAEYLCLRPSQWTKKEYTHTFASIFISIAIYILKSMISRYFQFPSLLQGWFYFLPFLIYNSLFPIPISLRLFTSLIKPPVYNPSPITLCCTSSTWALPSCCPHRIPPYLA